MSEKATTVDLWATYYPGKTPEQAYNEARDRQDEWFTLYQAQQAVRKTYHDCETNGDRAEYWKRLAAAQAAILRHDGIPGKWIDERGRDVVPPGVCRECWKPGATDIDRCDGCERRYHPACFTARSIRCHLRSAAFARIHGDEDRAAMWEQVALDKHLGGGAR